MASKPKRSRGRTQDARTCECPWCGATFQQDALEQWLTSGAGGRPVVQRAALKIGSIGNMIFEIVQQMRGTLIYRTRSGEKYQLTLSEDISAIQQHKN